MPLPFDYLDLDLDHVMVLNWITPLVDNQSQCTAY